MHVDIMHMYNRYYIDIDHKHIYVFMRMAYAWYVRMYASVKTFSAVLQSSFK